MNYQKMSVEELKKLKYPNLMAEFLGSHYSVCTLGEHMNLGRLPEDSPEVLLRLYGEIAITASEAVRLAHLFNVSIDYLIDHNLKTVEGVPYAYYRWRDEDEKYKNYLLHKQDAQKIDIEKEIKMSEAQAVVFLANTELGELYKAMVEHWNLENDNCMPFTASLFYNLGYAHGIRHERARRKK